MTAAATATKRPRLFRTSGAPRFGGGKVLANERGGTFRIVKGVYLGAPPKGPCVTGDGGGPCDACQVGDAGNHVYRQRRTDGNPAHPADPPEWDGDLIESDVDLCLRFNGPQRGNGTWHKDNVKFVRVDGADGKPPAVRPAPQPYPIDRMTYPELRGYAEELGIEVKGAAKREDLLGLVKAAVQARTGQAS